MLNVQGAMRLLWQCPAIFQLLAVKGFRGAGHVAIEPSRGPSLKQSQTQPLYQQFDLGQTPLGRFFKPPRVDPSSAGSPPQEKVQKSGVMLARPEGRVPTVADQTTPLPETWINGFVLGNPHNHCYMNASLLAFLHVMQDAGTTTRAVQAVRGLCQGFARRGATLVLSAQLLVRSTLRSWPFNRRQQDAAEFITVLLQSLGLSTLAWEARYPDPGGLQILHTGGAPISLQLRAEPCGMQDLIEDWHHQVYMHALTKQDGPILLHLARNANAVKNEAPISIASLVWLPFFGEGIDVSWRPFQVRATVEHHGESVVTGHYRAVLKTASGWMHTDDNLVSSPVLWSRVREKLMYLIWLVPVGPRLE